MTVKTSTTAVSIISQKGESTQLSKDPTYAKFLRSIGGLRGLRDLALHSGRVEARKLVELIDDPGFKWYGPKKLAQLAGLSFKSLVEMRNERAMLLAVSDLIVDHLPTILEGAAQDAKPSMDVCSKCDGLRVVKLDKDSEPVECSKCRGSGEIRVRGDKDSIKFIGEAVGLLKGAGGNVINVNAQAGVQVSNPHNSFEDLMKKSGQVITVEAERVEE